MVEPGLCFLMSELLLMTGKENFQKVKEAQIHRIDWAEAGQSLQCRSGKSKVSRQLANQQSKFKNKPGGVDRSLNKVKFWIQKLVTEYAMSLKIHTIPLSLMRV